MATNAKKSRASAAAAQSVVRNLTSINPVLGIMAGMVAPGVAARASDTRVTRANTGRRPGETSVAIAPPTPPAPTDFITPYDRQLAWIDNVLRGPLSIRQAAAVTGMLPAKGKPQTAQDAARGSAAAISEALYGKSVEAAMDPSYSKKQRDELIGAAMAEQIARLTNIAGGNPMNMLGLTAPTEDE